MNEPNPIHPRCRVLAALAGLLLLTPVLTAAQDVRLRFLESGGPAALEMGAFRLRATLGAPVGASAPGVLLHRVARRLRAAAAAPEAAAEIPQAYSLEPNYPNPFNPQTTIRVGLPEAARVRLDVFDVLGRRVATLLDEQRPAGWHTVVFEARALPSGVYFSRVEAGAFRQVGRMLLLR